MRATTIDAEGRDAATVPVPATEAATTSTTPTIPASNQRALRFLTAGSVDDGKSTLIGRLLLDGQAILADQLATLEARAAGAPIDLSLLTDGLEAEREQGITIDVAYRYFSTGRRKFIVADAPGHEQYTRNMVTAAAGSDAAVILVDATKLDLDVRRIALLPQTRRHALLAQLLRVPSIVFAINKIDAVDDAAAAYDAVRDALVAFAADAGIEVAGIVPISALRGDNVTFRRDVPWYRGPTLLALLESLPASGDDAAGALRIPVQYVERESRRASEAPSADACDTSDAGAPVARAALGERRTLWGRVAAGHVMPGDLVQVFPSGERATVADVLVAGTPVDVGITGQSVGLVLDRQLDVSRGDWLAAPGTVDASRRFGATLAWLDRDPAVVGRRYQLRHGHRWVPARIASIDGRLDIATLAVAPSDRLDVNEIGRVVIETQQALPIAPYRLNRDAGAMILVDPATHMTSGAVLVDAAA